MNGQTTGHLEHEKILLAATLVEDAKHLRHIEFKLEPRALRAYLLYNHWVMKIVVYFCILGNLALAIIEKPSINELDLPYWIPMCIETFFLLMFLGRFFHASYFQEKKKFWREPKNITVIVTIMLTVTDMACYVAWVHSPIPGVAAKAVRWSRPLRPLYLVNFPEGRQIRQAFQNIVRTLPDIANVFVLFVCCVAVFSLMALKILRGKGMIHIEGTPYFDNYWDSFWDMYVLVTTSNYPDVMMPAYDVHGGYTIFFMIYLLLCLYVFMSIVLAVIYNRYRIYLKSEVMTYIKMKRKLLGQAFDILKMESGDCYVVSKRCWLTLMNQLEPKMSQVRLKLLFAVLDEGAKDCLDRKDFLKIADLLNVELFEVQLNSSFLEKHCSCIYFSRPSQLLQKCVKHRFFKYSVDLLILANAICMAFDWDIAEWFFLGVFSAEILLKIYVWGPVGFFKTFWHKFDFFIIAFALVATVLDSFLQANPDRRSLIDLILVMRVLRIIRLGAGLDRFKVVIRTIINIGPSIVTYGAVILVLYYVYAIVGMELFMGKIKFFGYENLNASQMYCGTPKLNGSEFYIKHYCKNNFNNVGNAFVLLFELTIVNQWHVLAEGFVLVTTKAARLYFISFHMLCVVVLLNILIAFVLEVFVLEYTLTESTLQTRINEIIREMGLGMGENNMEENPREHVGHKKEPHDEAKSPDGEVDMGEMSSAKQQPSVRQAWGVKVMFRIKKTSSKSIGILLQNMFESELEPEELNEVDLVPKEVVPKEVNQRKTTKSNVGINFGLTTRL